MELLRISLSEIFEKKYFKDLLGMKGYKTKVILVDSKENRITFRYKCYSRKREVVSYLLKMLGLCLPIFKEGKNFCFTFQIIYIRNKVDCMSSVILEAACMDCSTLPENHYHQLHSNLLTRKVRSLLKLHGVKGVIIPSLNLSDSTMIQFDDIYGDLVGNLNLVRPVVFKGVNPHFGFMFITS